MATEAATVTVVVKSFIVLVPGAVAMVHVAVAEVVAAAACLHLGVPIGGRGSVASQLIQAALPDFHSAPWA